MANYTKALAKAQNKYRRSTRSVCIRFTKDELNLYDHICIHQNKSKYVKDLIAKDIENSK